MGGKKKKITTLFCLTNLRNGLIGVTWNFCCYVNVTQTVKSVLEMTLFGLESRVETD